MATQAQILRRQQNEALLRNPLVAGFLDTIAATEGTGNDYNQIVGEASGSGTITDFSAHPGVMRTLNIRGKKTNSSAAGRYQFIGSTYAGVGNRTGLTDFSPHSQDVNAVELLRESGALDKLLAGDVQGAVRAAGTQWASLPGTLGRKHNQRQVSMGTALGHYNAALQARGVSPEYAAALGAPGAPVSPGTMLEAFREAPETPHVPQVPPVPAVLTRQTLLDNLTRFFHDNTQASVVSPEQPPAGPSPEVAALTAKLAALTPTDLPSTNIPTQLTNPADAFAALDTEALDDAAAEARSSALNAMFDSGATNTRLSDPIEVALNRIVKDELNG